MLIKSGIYKIENTVNGKVYVGSSVNIYSRLNNHIGTLRKGTHYNPKLLRAWEKHKEESFIYSILEIVEDRSLLIAREQHYIDVYEAATAGYNICIVADRRSGLKASIESRKKLSESRKGMKFTDEHRKKLSMAKLGRKQTLEAREKRSIATKGRVFTDEHKRNLSIGCIAREQRKRDRRHAKTN